MTSDPLVTAIAQLLTRTHTGTNQPVTPAPWMTAAAGELAAAVADGCRRNLSVHKRTDRCLCAEINREINRRADA